MSLRVGGGLPWGVGAGLSEGQELATMKATVVQYKAKPERAAENQQLIETVFADLELRRPAGFSYQVFRLEDGVSFVHVVVELDAERSQSLTDVPAFRDFVAEIADRCVVPPAARGATVVGSYR
jgi:hypothetical protein